MRPVTRKRKEVKRRHRRGVEVQQPMKRRRKKKMGLTMKSLNINDIFGFVASHRRFEGHGRRR
jgi:hypothetical protein